MEQTDSSQILTQKQDEIKQNNGNFRYKESIFLASVAGISALIGFSSTLARTKKSDPKYFDSGLAKISVEESAVSLAIRALKWGTFFAFSGCGVLFYTIWKLSGANNLQDFRNKMGTILPRIPKNDPPKSRTEFSGLNDLFEYLQTLKSDKDE